MTHSPTLTAALAASLLAGCATVTSRPIERAATPSLDAIPPLASSAPVVDQDCPDGSFSCRATEPVATTASAVSSTPTQQFSRPTSSIGVDGDREGLSYYLPRQLVKVTAKRTEPDLDKALTELGAAQKKESGAAAALTAVEQETAATKQALIEHADNLPVRDLLMAELEKLEKARVVAETAKTKTAAANKEALDKVLAYKAGAAAGTGRDTTLKIELLPLSADPQFGFRLDPRHSVLRDDKHKFDITPAGLLTSTDIVAVDRTGDVLVELSVLLGALQGGAPVALMRSLEKPADCATVENQVIAIVDLANEREVARLKQDLRCLRVRIKTEEPVSRGDLANAGNFKSAHGIFYRRPADLPIRIEYCAAEACVNNDNAWLLRERLIVPLPQLGDVSVLRQDAGLMTRTAYKVGFKDGIPVSYDADRPSEALEVARTPMRLIDGLFTGFSKIVSLRTGRNEQLSALSASELATLQTLERDRATVEAYRVCAAAKRAEGESVLPCLDKVE